MFVDQADIEVFAGDGGRGCVSFRKEKYVPQGGPDGGDGGDGGSVYLEATPGVDTLLDMVGRHHWHAEHGGLGMGKKKAGKDGGDLVIRLPAGTLVYDQASGILVADLKELGQRVRIAQGGRGGKGNIHFVTSVRQAPDFAEPGRKGQTRALHLELRLIADVGIVGLPNAGKSTLLSRISAARPKIADYPFTTLSPQLGIAELDAERRLVLADIPGLIEGAHDGAGLGLDFLRHIERTRVLVHIIDVLPVDGSQPIDAYRQIRGELEAYSPKLAGKPEILVANKMDLAGASEALADLRTELPGKQIFALSAVSGTGLRPLLEALWRQVENAPASEPLVEERPYVPPEAVRARPEEEMFVYAEGEGDADAWEPVDEEAGGANGGVLEGVDEREEMPGRFVNAAGERMKPVGQEKKSAERGKRLLLTPEKAEGDRTTARQRKKAHAARVGERFPPPVAPSEPATEPASEPPLDASLAAEIAAMKADDVRKGKYYTRGPKTDA